MNDKQRKFAQDFQNSAFAELMETEQEQVFFDSFQNADPVFFKLYQGDRAIHPPPWWRRMLGPFYLAKYRLADWLHSIACRLGASCDWD